jgi:DNA-directed RNA polymerase specialized sigma24 family protein
LVVDRNVAAQQLFDRLYAMALRWTIRRNEIASYDDEQVAMDSVESMFGSYFENRAFEFQTDIEVFAILRTVTENKRDDSIRAQIALARTPRDGDGKLIPFVSLERSRCGCKAPLEDPSLICEHDDEIAHWLKLLSDPLLCNVFLLRLQEWTFAEIAMRLEVNESQIRSSMCSIRRILTPHTKHQARNQT